MPPSLWMGIHMAVGCILVAITAVRFLLLAMPTEGAVPEFSALAGYTLYSKPCCWCRLPLCLQQEL